MFYQFQHFGISGYFCKEYGKNINFPVHLHNSYEFVYITEGEIEITIDSTVYNLKKGDSVLIFPHQLHSFSSESSKHMLCIFSPELVQAFSSKILNKKPINNALTVNQYLVDALDNIQETSSTFEKKGLLYSICAEFSRNAEYKSIHSFDENILQKIFDFVEKNYKDDCKLQSLANETGYNYSYLSRIFKRVTGISFNNYTNRYRISNACYLLNNSNNSILQCALESGYDSVRSFNRNFKNALGITPAEYQKKIRTETK